MKLPSALVSIESTGFPFISRFVRSCSTLVPTVLLLILSSAATQAGTWDWNATSGNWSDAANWSSSTNPGTVPGILATDVINFTNGTALAPAETNVINLSKSDTGQLTIGRYNTLTLNSNLSTLVGGSFTNHGTVQTSGVRVMTVLSSGGVGILNDGTIQVLSGGNLTLRAFSATNTGGTILAQSGGTLTLSDTAILTNGLLKSAVGGAIIVGESNQPNSTQTLTGVTVINEGSFTSQQLNDNRSSGSLTVITALGTGTQFTNALNATTRVLNTGTGAQGSATAINSSFNVNAGATFTNAGTLLIQNDATRTSTNTLSQSTVFTVASGASAFTTTGTIKVIANSNAVGATAAFTSAKTITNEGIVYVKGNAADAAASFSVTGTGNNYVQSGVGIRRTILEQGGALSAAGAVLIETGTLGGVGTVTGATTIGGDATLAAGETLDGTAGAGTLVFNSTLTLANGASIRIGLGQDTASSGQIVLRGSANLSLGSNLTLSLLDHSGGTWISGATYRLFDLGSGSISGNLGSITLSLPTGWIGTLSFAEGGTDFIDVTLVAVPEPASIALVLGLATLTVACRRRRD